MNRADGASAPGPADPRPAAHHAERADAAGTPYHRLATLRPEWAAWNRALLALLAAFIAYVVMASVLLVGTILVLALLPGVNVALDIVSGDLTSPLDVTLALAMGALWLPAGLIGVRFGGWRPLGPTWSVAAHLRRSPVRQLGLWAVVAGLAAVALAAIVGAITGSPDLASDLAVQTDAPGAAQLVLVVLIALVLAPLQAAGLELTMRGLLMQAVGTWLRSPAWPIVAASAVILVGRDLTAPVLIPALALALSAAVLAWKSGGLELPLILTTTVTVGSIVSSALASGTGAAAGTAALAAASAAPGTSVAALSAADETAALSGGIAAALTLLALTVVLASLISRKAGIGLLQPVTRPATEPAPAVVPH